MIDSTISLGKYGSFKTDHLIGRPYHVTYEILDQPDPITGSGLRIVPSAELYEGIHQEENAPTPESEPEVKIIQGKDGEEYEVVGQNGEVILRTNRATIDNPKSQKLSMDEIEALKLQNTGSGREVVAKILASHVAIDQKTAFALAKYKLRKTKKFLKRFTILPMDVPLLADWLLNEKEAIKILEMRQEVLALIGSWANVHRAASASPAQGPETQSQSGGGRWLVVDETGGLIVAAMAEKMGILHPQSNRAACPEKSADREDVPSDQPEYTSPLHHNPTAATSNTITLIHAASQPNLSLLRYFGFSPATPSQSHPLTTHLRTLSWLQVLDSASDPSYTEPPLATPEEMAAWKSGRRGNYYRKRRRWERVKSAVDETRAGGFDGLIIASVMQPTSILQHLVPLLRGAAQVVVYSPTVAPVAELNDSYSSARRTAFMNIPVEQRRNEVPSEDFPVDPTLLLGTTIYTARARRWQVLPGRTHPLMNGRGGAEGFVFVGTRVLPIEGVEARGKFQRRKRKGDDGGLAEEQGMGMALDTMEADVTPVDQGESQTV